MGGADKIDGCHTLRCAIFIVTADRSRPSAPYDFADAATIALFDHVEQQYKVWALVRFVGAMAEKEAELPRFEVGVAFIGNALLPAMIWIHLNATKLPGVSQKQVYGRCRDPSSTTCALQ